MTDDPFDLARFVAAQDGVYATALAELQAGQKRSHWIWFVFPQLIGLGRSPTAQRYAIRSLDEARAYLAHPLLGPRLCEATAVMLTHRDRRLDAILGSPDDLKFRSSMSLFARAGGPDEMFGEALRAFCDGWTAPDPER